MYLLGENPIKNSPGSKRCFSPVRSLDGISSLLPLVPLPARNGERPDVLAFLEQHRRLNRAGCRGDDRFEIDRGLPYEVPITRVDSMVRHRWNDLVVSPEFVVVNVRSANAVYPGHSDAEALLQ